jgi:Zn-dependent protease
LLQLNLDPIYLVSAAIALLLGLTFHEFAHAWSANRLGDPTPRWAGRVTLNPLAHLDPIGTIMLVLMMLGVAPIGWGKPVPVNPAYMRWGRRGMALTGLAGPLSNLLLALVVALIWRLIYTITGIELWQYPGAYALVSALLSLNILLAIFNLLPIPPLDGFGILEGIAPPSWDRALGVLRQYGMWILLLLVLLPALSGAFGRGVSPLGLILGPLYNGLAKLFAALAGLPYL